MEASKNKNAVSAFVLLWAGWLLGPDSPGSSGFLSSFLSSAFTLPYTVLQPFP